MHISTLITSLVLWALCYTAHCGVRNNRLSNRIQNLLQGKSKAEDHTAKNGGDGLDKRGDGDQTDKLRMIIPTYKIQWKEYGGVQWKRYNPVSYTKPKEWKLFDKKKADDPVETDFHRKVNGKKLYDFHQKQQLTYKGYEGLWIDRSGYNYEYKLDSKGRPLYPEGRRGLDGLGGPWWGPVHAVDIAITVKNGNDMEVIVIERTLNEGWALPGGKVDPVEKNEMLDNRHPGGLSDAVLIALKKQFVEKVLGYGSSDKNVPKVAKRVQELQDCLWSKVTPVVVYSGPVKKDRRNRDHSWFDTKVVVFHIEHMTKAEVEEKCFKLGEGGTDHGVVENGVHWMKFSELKGKTFFASHEEFIGHVDQCSSAKEALKEFRQSLGQKNIPDLPRSMTREQMRSDIPKALEKPGETVVRKPGYSSETIKLSYHRFNVYNIYRDNDIDNIYREKVVADLLGINEGFYETFDYDIHTKQQAINDCVLLYEVILKNLDKKLNSIGKAPKDEDHDKPVEGTSLLEFELLTEFKSVYDEMKELQKIQY